MKTINFSSFSLLTGYSVAPVSYKIDQGAEIVYPSSLTLLGTRCTFEGLVVGVHRLVVAEGADVVFASTTQTGVSVNQSINQSATYELNNQINASFGHFFSSCNCDLFKICDVQFH